MFPADDDSDASGPSSPTGSQILMHLSVAAVSGAVSSKTLCLSGEIHGQPISILVDSGSSHTFLSKQLAHSFDGIQNLSPVLQVQVANGAVLQCNSHIPQATWSVQGYHFTSDLKLLELSSFDMILGLDWLSSFSLMQVHWAQRWISIPYKGATTLLIGDRADLPVGSIIQLCLVQQLESSQSVSSLNPAIQALVTE
jgi:hypothetical protein